MKYFKKTVDMMSKNFTDSKEFKKECVKMTVLKNIFIIISIITIFLPFGNFITKALMCLITAYAGYKLIKQSKIIKDFRFTINYNNLYDYSLFRTIKKLEKLYLEMVFDEEEITEENITDIEIESDINEDYFIKAESILKEDISGTVEETVSSIKKISEKYMDITDRKKEILETLKKNTLNKSKKIIDVFELYNHIKNMKCVPDILLPYIIYSYIYCFGNEEQIKYFRIMKTYELLDKSANNIEMLKAITYNKENLKYDEAGEIRNMYEINETVEKTIENYLGFSPKITKYNIDKFIFKDLNFDI